MKKLLFQPVAFIFLSLPSVAQIITTPDTTICIGGTATMAVISSPSYGTSSYTFEIIPFAPETFDGAIPNNDYCSVGGGTPYLGDDCFSVPIDIGFSFCFLNESYTECYIGSNGWVSFTDPPNPWTNFTSTTIPNTGTTVPKNCIMGPWQDWTPSGCTPIGSCIKYQTIGTAPFRKFVVSWDMVPLYGAGCGALLGEFQIVLNETTNIIENHIVNKPDGCGWAGGTATQGVHSADGLTAYTVPGRNSTVWEAINESTRFVPSGVDWLVAGFAVGYGDTLIASPTVTTTYTVSMVDCDGVEYTTDITVTVIDNDPSFNYAATYCSAGTATPTITGDLGGTFTADPASMVIDPATGEIDLDATPAGVYTITYDFGAPCFETASDVVTIVNDPDASFTYPDITFCPTGTVLPDFIATPGGTFTISPAGMTINAATGLVDLSTGTVGTTYTVTYTVGVFCVSSTTQTITIIPLDDATFAYSAPSFCPTGTASPTYITTPGGTFTVSPGGLSVNATTGVIDLTTGTPGTTYTITYTTAAGPCSNTSSVTVTIDPLDDATFTYPESSYCPTGTAVPTVTGVGGGSFTIWPTTMTINAATGTLNLYSGNVGTTYTITYTTPAGPCSNTSTFEVAIDPLDDPYFTYGVTDFCPYGTALPTVITTPGGSFTISPAGPTINTATGLIDFTTATPGATYTVTYTTPAGPCSDNSSIIINVLPFTDAAFAYANSAYCATGTVSPSYVLNPGGSFSADAGISINAFSGEINLGASISGGPYDVVYSSPGCTESDTFQITINPLPTPTIDLADIICLESSAITILGDPPGGSFSGDGVAGDLFDPALVGSTGIYDVTYTYTDANGCTNTVTDYIQIMENAVSLGLDVYIPEYTTTILNAEGGVTFSWDPDSGLSCNDCPNPTVDIMNTTTYTVTSWDENGCVAYDDIIVNIVPVFDPVVFVPNTFTPNGDNINDIFFAYGSDLITILSMSIFDRWGEQLYFAENISALDPSEGWDGTYRGKELTEGVYVYMIEVLLKEGVRQQIKGNVTILK